IPNKFPLPDKCPSNPHQTFHVPISPFGGESPPHVPMYPPHIPIYPHQTPNIPNIAIKSNSRNFSHGSPWMVPSPRNPHFPKCPHVPTCPHPTSGGVPRSWVRTPPKFSVYPTRFW